MPSEWAMLAAKAIVDLQLAFARVQVTDKEAAGQIDAAFAEPNAELERLRDSERNLLGCIAFMNKEVPLLRQENERLKRIIDTADGKDAESFDWSVLGEMDRLESESAALRQQVETLRTALELCKTNPVPWCYGRNDPAFVRFRVINDIATAATAPGAST